MFLLLVESIYVDEFQLYSSIYPLGSIRQSRVMCANFQCRILITIPPCIFGSGGTPRYLSGTSWWGERIENVLFHFRGTLY